MFVFVSIMIAVCNSGGLSYSGQGSCSSWSILDLPPAGGRPPEKQDYIETYIRIFFPYFFMIFFIFSIYLAASAAKYCGKGLAAIGKS